jgi:signal transduction histidine kinase
VKAAGKTIRIDIRDDLSYTGDRAQIQKMMSVLLDNAVRYGDEKGKIEFSVFREKKLHIRVWNSCHFDSPPDLKRLFDRFYRPDSSRNALTGGTGIGLSLAKAVAEKHGGTITAKCSDADSIVFEVVL